MVTQRIRQRVKELRWVTGSELLPHDQNWRRHPAYQRAALQGVLNEVGFADALIAYEDSAGHLRLIDGHLRREMLPNEQVPVLVLDVDEAEARKLLVTLDPLAAMAQPDMDVLLALLQETEFQDKAVRDVLESLVNGETAPMPDFTAYPDLPSGDKGLLGQMTFTVTEVQREQIEVAVAIAKRGMLAIDTGNENSHGNALTHICAAFITAELHA